MIDKKLFRLISEQKKKIILISFLMLLSFSFEVFFTISLLSSLYKVLIVSDEDVLMNSLVCALCGISLDVIFSLISNLLKNRVGNEIRNNLRMNLLKKVFNVGNEIYSKVSKAELTQLSVEGIENIDTYFSQFLPTFFFSISAPFVMFIGCLVGYFITGLHVFWIYGLVCFLLVFLIPMSIMFVSRFAKKVFRKYWNTYIRLGKTFEDSLRGLKELKDFNASIRKGEKLKEESEEFRKATMKVLTMQLWSVTLMDAVTYGGSAIGSSIVVINAFNNYPYYSSNIGSSLLIIDSIILIILAIRFFLPLRRMGSLFHVAMNGVMAGEKILNILDIKENEYGSIELDDINEISISNLSYKYSDGNNDVLINVNLEFNRPGIYYLVGESGSGKSTLAKLLSRNLCAPNEQIKINSIDINNISNQSFFKNIGYLDNDSHIFFGTLKSLFKFYKADITDEEIINSLKSVNLDYLLYRKEGLDFEIEENGNNLSGGEKERLALCLSLLVPKQVYIFDEVTSNVDKTSCLIINKKIKSLSSNHIIIYITHNLLETVEENNIFLFDNGEIKQSGSFKELINIEGTFKDTFDIQKKTMEEEL